MKKSTGSILLLSAFAALVLAGCDNGPKDSSTSTGSSDTAVTTSADETSTPAGNSDSATSTGTSAAGTSTTTSSASSSAAASSSATASSSTQPVETDWSNKNFIGEYKGGMSNLIINSDKTTSWGTDPTKFPATYTDLGGGVYEIKSATSVDAEDYVEIITDGTMAYVMHDKDAKDYYVMDKNALGGAVIAFAETEDETKFFGGIEVTSGHWKYFACINGTYTFNVAITVQAGTNINAGGAIFDYGTGTSKTSWKVTSPAVAATSFATIEQTNFTATTYTGDHGDLVIGTDDEGLVFATLSGVALPGATLSGNTLTVPKANSEVSYDMTNSAGPQKVTETTIYTLATIALTYTQSEGTAQTPLFDEATGMTGSYSSEVGADGHIWVWFTAPVGGKITITETQGTSCEDYYGDPEDYIVVYDTATTSATGYGSTYGGVGYKTNDYYTGDLILSNLVVKAGHTYVVRVGGSDDNSKDFKGTGSAYEGETVAISWVFSPFAQETYTGEAGDLVIEKDGTTVMGVSLNGTVMDSYTLSGNTLTTVSNVIDMSNPSDPTHTKTTTVLTLNGTDGTYTSVSTPVTTHPFHVLTDSDTSYSADTGNDGNVWMIYTATEDGVIDLKETNKGVSDSFLQVFEWGPNSKLEDLVQNGPGLIDDCDTDPAQLTIHVQAGKSYVIKLGAWGARNTLVGETTTIASYIGCPETMSFSFANLIYHTYTGAEGDLVITTKNGNCVGATLDGNDVEGYTICDLDNGSFTVVGQQTLDLTTDPNNPALTSTDDVFTLDLVNNTYTKASVAASRPAIQTLDEDSTYCNGAIGADGSMWATFTPTHYGLLTLEETIQCNNGGTGNSAHDSLVAIYEKTSTTTYSSYTGYTKSSNSAVVAGTDNGYSLVKLENVFLEAGHTYIIKIGAYAASSVGFGGSLAAANAGFIGSAEAFEMSYEVLPSATYTNATGEPLTIITRAGNVYKTLLGSTEISGSLAENGKSFTVPGTIGAVDTTNPSDPVANVTSTAYYIDNEEFTYELGTEVETIHLFHTIQPTDTFFSGIVANDGNLWGKFTAPEAGTITVEETVSTSGDGYIQIFDSTAQSYVSSNALKTADSGAALSGAGKISNFSVSAGHTYIIKAGNYYDKDKLIGGSGTSTYAGKAETVAFTFRGADHEVFTGPEGEFHKLTLGGTYIGATLDGEAFNGTPNTDKTVYTNKVAVLDTDTFDVTVTDKTYTLGEGTYEVEAVSETANILSDTWDAANTGDYAAAANGSVLIKFTAPETGSYTFKALASTDCKVGLYAAVDANGLVGSPLTGTEKDLASANREETFTYNCEAGVTYYFRASAYYGEWSKSITDLTSTRAGTTITMTIEH